ncbi:MAG: hypothetical protein O2971_16590 [Proteobacteria bacterium]|nr:hypothetical protein [Pseudomonadota bacterium]
MLNKAVQFCVNRVGRTCSREQLIDQLERLAARTPGTGLNIAMQKRAMEKGLRAAGYSRAQSVEIASRYYGAADHDV